MALTEVIPFKEGTKDMKTMPGKIRRSKDQSEEMEYTPRHEKRLWLRYHATRKYLTTLLRWTHTERERRRHGPTDPDHPDKLEAKGQDRLDMDLGLREVPKRRDPKVQDRGYEDLPLFTQPDDRQVEVPVEGL